MLPSQIWSAQQLKVLALARCGNCIITMDGALPERPNSLWPSGCAGHPPPAFRAIDPAIHISDKLPRRRGTGKSTTQRIVGMTNSAPARIPVGQREVIV